MKKLINYLLMSSILIAVICLLGTVTAFAEDGALSPDDQPSVTEEIEKIDGVENTVVTLSRREILYVGTVQRPLVTVKDKNGSDLVYKKDFTVSYSDINSTNVGEYTVTVNYIGDYTGSIYYTYTILPRTDAVVSINRSVIFANGTVQRPMVFVKGYGGKELKYKEDFTVEYSNWCSMSMGTYTVTVNMIGNYMGTQTLTYQITDFAVTLSRTSITYCGTVQRPKVTVKDKSGKELTYKKDFTVGYSNWNSTNAGTYTVTINYIGKYSGKTVYEYKIVPQTSVTVTLSRTNITKNGTVQRPTVTVKDKNGKQLVYKTDFTVDYSNWNSTDAGAYKVTVKMKGNYSGTKTYTYYIDESTCLPLNKTATHISYEYSNVEKYVFGSSYQNRNLEAFIITPTNGKYTKTFVMNFAIHGFEDWYSRDGQVLTQEANRLVEYYAKNPDKLKSFRLVIIPCLNPDGAIAGVNNKRETYDAFGRCTANHIDMNRDFPSCRAVESKAMKNLLNKYKPDVFTDVHGWYNKSYGDSTLTYIYNKNLGLGARLNNEYYSTYLYAYVRNTYKCPSALLEYASPSKVNHTQTYNAVNEIISYYNK